MAGYSDFFKDIGSTATTATKGLGSFLGSKQGETTLGLGKLFLDYRADREQNKLNKEAFNFNKTNIQNDLARKASTTNSAGDALSDSGLVAKFGSKKKKEQGTAESTGLGTLSN